MPRLGVVGTMVWDMIHAHEASSEGPFEAWGGISYALSAADAALPDDWTLFPLIKLGADLSEPAERYFADLEHVDCLEGVRTVPEPNNRVELTYQDAQNRTERLTGGVPGWTVDELVPLARSCDALYVNFISGWELELTVAAALRGEFDGWCYGDLHSLMLGVDPHGVRSLRPLETPRAWLGCFDMVQMNEHEFETLADGYPDPWDLAVEVIGDGAAAFLVTRGVDGAAWMASTGVLEPGAGTRTRASCTDGARATLDRGADPLRGSVSPGDIVAGGDPTGCGDVWGATCFSTFLGGASLEESMTRASAAASRNAAYRGASGLNAYLLSSTGLVTGGEAT